MITKHLTQEQWELIKLSLQTYFSQIQKERDDKNNKSCKLEYQEVLNEIEEIMFL